jgi:hypothetical protein
LPTLAVVTSVQNQFERKAAGVVETPQTAHTRATVSEPSAALQRIHAQKSARIEFSASRQRVGGHEIWGFSARRARAAQDENLIPPAGLKRLYRIRRKYTPHCQQVTISPKVYPHRDRS